MAKDKVRSCSGDPGAANDLQKLEEETQLWTKPFWGGNRTKEQVSRCVKCIAHLRIPFYLSFV